MANRERLAESSIDSLLQNPYSQGALLEKLGSCWRTWILFVHYLSLDLAEVKAVLGALQWEILEETVALWEKQPAADKMADMEADIFYPI